MIRQVNEESLRDYVSALDVDQIVAVAREALDSECSVPSARTSIAPGRDIVARLFRHFGLEYTKPGDTMRIAREMRIEDIAPKIEDVLREIASLAQRRQRLEHRGSAESAYRLGCGGPGAGEWLKAKHASKSAGVPGPHNRWRKRRDSNPRSQP